MQYYSAINTVLYLWIDLLSGYPSDSGVELEMLLTGQLREEDIMLGTDPCHGANLVKIIMIWNVL